MEKDCWAEPWKQLAPRGGDGEALEAEVRGNSSMAVRGQGEELEGRRRLGDEAGEASSLWKVWARPAAQAVREELGRCTQTLDTRLTETGSLCDGQGLGLPSLVSVVSWWRQGLWACSGLGGVGTQECLCMHWVGLLAL